MPQYKTHIQAGIISWALLLFGMTCINRYFNFARAMEFLFFAILGALVPDIDTKSKGRAVFYRLFIGALLILFVFKWWNVLAMVIAIAVLAMLAPHRAIFHNMWFIVSMVIGAVLFASTISPAYSKIVMMDGLFFLIGAASHVFLDVGWRRFLQFRW